VADEVHARRCCDVPAHDAGPFGWSFSRKSGFVKGPPGALDFGVTDRVIDCAAGVLDAPPDRRFLMFQARVFENRLSNE
jgi:hypothetical protein